jgi:hypothetical protein
MKRILGVVVFCVGLLAGAHAFTPRDREAVMQRPEKEYPHKHKVVVVERRDPVSPLGAIWAISAPLLAAGIFNVLLWAVFRTRRPPHE